VAELIVSVDEARELLGDSAVNLTDEQIEEVIMLLDEIAKEALRQSRQKYSTDKLS
jgi:dsDNA-binding SOS-regulon protein